jgi:hypothetical protein
MFDYINQKRDPVAVIFYCGLIQFGLFWVIRRSFIAGFVLQAYVITIIVFVFYPFEMKVQNLKQWSFWKRMLQVGVSAHLLLLTGLWFLDANYPVFVTGTGTVFFTAFVAGIIETVVVGEILDRPRLTDDGLSGKS